MSRIKIRFVEKQLKVDGNFLEHRHRLVPGSILWIIKQTPVHLRRSSVSYVNPWPTNYCVSSILQTYSTQLHPRMYVCVYIAQQTLRNLQPTRLFGNGSCFVKFAVIYRLVRKSSYIHRALRFFLRSNSSGKNLETISHSLFLATTFTHFSSSFLFFDHITRYDRNGAKFKQKQSTQTKFHPRIYLFKNFLAITNDREKKERKKERTPNPKQRVPRHSDSHPTTEQRFEDPRKLVERPPLPFPPFPFPPMRRTKVARTVASKHAWT